MCEMVTGKRLNRSSHLENAVLDNLQYSRICEMCKVDKVDFVGRLAPGLTENNDFLILTIFL